MHDLNQLQAGLTESLSQAKHPIGLLLGAGCPMSIRVGSAPLIPDVTGLTTNILAAMKGDSHCDELLKQFVEDGRTKFTIEDLLSQLRQLKRIVGKGVARGLDMAAIKSLETALCLKVADSVSASLPSTASPYHKLARWASGVSRSTAVDIFTTNYDLLLEQAFEEVNAPYFDGFIGAREPFFDVQAIENDSIPSRWTRIWKLHGSVNWEFRTGTKTVVRSPKPGSALLIHPSELKYDESRRMPFLALFDRLRAFLRQPSALLLVCGYSFSDQHLNETLLQSFSRNPSASGRCLLFGKLATQTAAEKLLQSAPRNLAFIAKDEAQLRGVRSVWTSPGGTPSECTYGDFDAFSSLLGGL